MKILNTVRAWARTGSPASGCYVFPGEVRLSVSGLRSLGLGDDISDRRLGEALRRVSVRQVTTRLPDGSTPKLWVVAL